MTHPFHHDAETVFKGKRFSVVRTRGTPPREIVVHPGAVVILPLVDANSVAMIRNERVAVGETLWELPAGTLEPGESPQACAERELIEETGYRARKVTPLLELFSSPGICNEAMFVFLAEGLELVGQDLDEGEKITVEIVPMARVMQMVRENQVRDGKTIASLLYYQAFVASA
jgi:ADP-ribose pyrophosphatase